MIPVVPAFGGVPGAPELVIVLIVLVLLFGVPVVLIAGVVLFLRLREDGEEANGNEADADRIAELEAEVERLREAVDDGNGDDGDEDDGDGDDGDGDDGDGDNPDGNVDRS